MNAKEVELAVVNYFNARQNLIVPNVSWGFSGLYYEADLVILRKSGYAVEVEIKISRADLIKDKNKKHTHDFNKFKELYFAIPQKLLKDIEHIPEKAGILVCEKIEYENKFYYRAKLHRRASTSKAEPLQFKDRYGLARLGTMRIWKLKRKILGMQVKKI